MVSPQSIASINFYLKNAGSEESPKEHSHLGEQGRSITEVQQEGSVKVQAVWRISQGCSSKRKE
jgi:hypothetical protein